MLPYKGIIFEKYSPLVRMSFLRYPSIGYDCKVANSVNNGLSQRFSLLSCRSRRHVHVKTFGGARTID